LANEGGAVLKKILLIGGGGHCHSVIDSILSIGAYNAIGIIDNNKSSWLGIDTIGTDDDIPDLVSDGWHNAFITAGSVGNTQVRHRLFEMAELNGLDVVSIIDPTAIVARGTTIGKGVFVGKQAVINAGSRIGDCAIVNTGAIIEHDCEVGAFSHISPGSVLCGQVSVGADSHVGAGSSVIQQVKIGESSIIGAGSVVVKDIPSMVKAYGNPCRVVE
jgi:sugar O-acyltransferase (sialic acid O-acetyltransferase NeuD family)